MNIQWIYYIIYLMFGLLAGYGLLHVKIKWSLRKTKINKTLKKIEDLIKDYNHIIDLFKQDENLDEKRKVNRNIYIFLNSFSYLLHILCDFMAIYGSIILCDEMSVHKFHLDILYRSLAVQIHEICSKVNKSVLNANFKNALIFMVKFCEDEDPEIQYDWIRDRQEKFNRQMEKHRVLLKEIRNTVGAHREIDTLVFDKFICDLDYDLIIDLANHTLFFVGDIVKKINEIEMKFQDKIQSETA